MKVIEEEFTDYDEFLIACFAIKNSKIDLGMTV